MLTKKTWEEFELEIKEIKKGHISLTNRCEKVPSKHLKYIFNHSINSH